MNTGLNIDLLSKMVREKRGILGLRVAANDIGGISAPTLSRVEKGKIPDVDTFIKICKWLDVPTDTFISSNSNSSKQKLIAHLRAEKELEPETIDMLVRVIELAYNK